ncbi:MAG TPA: choice-of-anchor Q domain-containing protein [Rhodanobacteraceae bacterium]
MATCIAAICASTIATAKELPFAPGNTDVVTNCDDSGAGSLRAIIASAGSGDTIDLTHLTCAQISLTTGGIPIPQIDLQLLGPGRDKLTLDGGLVRSSGVLYHTGAGVLNILDLTIAHGVSYHTFDDARGGCIHSAGSVQLLRSTVSGCTAYNYGAASALGGGIWAAGQVYLDHSMVSGNYATAIGAGYASGGGVYANNGFIANYSTISRNLVVNNIDTATSTPAFAGGVFARGAVLIASSTISGNQGHIIGGVALVDRNGTPATILSSTISGNTSYQIGGVYALVPLSVANSTIAFNTEVTASDGTNSYAFAAGLQIAYGGDTAQSSIVANNTASDLGEFDLSGSIAGIGGHNNLIMQFNIGVPGDTVRADPDLGPLQDNGGPTHTQRPFSPAVLGFGSNSLNLGWDQRGIGFPRVVDGSVDIGAYQTNSDVIFINGFD